MFDNSLAYYVSVKAWNYPHTFLCTLASKHSKCFICFILGCVKDRHLSCRSHKCGIHNAYESHLEIYRRQSKCENILALLSHYTKHTLIYSSTSGFEQVTCLFITLCVFHGVQRKEFSKVCC